MTKLLPLVLVLAFTGCAHKQVYKDTAAWTDAPDKSIQLQVLRAKFRGSKIDLHYAIKNNYPFTVVVREGSITVASGGETGSAPTSPRLEIRPGQVIPQRIIARFGEKPEGALSLNLAPVFKGEEYTKDVNVSGASFGMQSGTDRTAASTLTGGFSHTSTGIKVKGAVDGDQLPGVSVNFTRD